jgi:hypothetical protein
MRFLEAGSFRENWNELNVNMNLYGKTVSGEDSSHSLRRAR